MMDCRIGARSMPWICEKLKGQRIKSLTFQAAFINGATKEEDVTDEHLPALIDCIKPKSPADAICKQVYFELD